MLSIFDLFKIGIGPSSSHTVGPMKAARMFLLDAEREKLLDQISELTIELFGSLALTGRGHGTDRALCLGLIGHLPEEVDPALVEDQLAEVRQNNAIRLLGRRNIAFTESRNLIFHPDKVLPRHSNGLRFTAYGSAGQQLKTGNYYSIGGGFVATDTTGKSETLSTSVPYEFKSGEDLLLWGMQHGKTIAEMVLANELCWRSEDEISKRIRRIWAVMEGCMERGLKTEGLLPGGLNIPRRAPRLAKLLTYTESVDPLDVMDWVNVYAIAVNEENAAGGRVVTAPTNGAAGIIPAVIKYYQRFCKDATEEGLIKFFLTAGAIGILYKENASISGAEVGCQGEVGVACSMAAAGLAAALGGSNQQVENAAEIGMEHHLGMTCDPVGGLVQIPCIERNALGAMKAINSARIALKGDGSHQVSLDEVIKTMYETGKDMKARYKETSQAGLALHVVRC
ncbi:MAG TPA: L-serine ammonia-lyase [Candidatus Angelobacter sp.]|jgi:L-serine dehydratase|nr:L-serine ammonia-lyase [Candidatus Angelobacter sp.]